MTEAAGASTLDTPLHQCLDAAPIISAVIVHAKPASLLAGHTCHRHITAIILHNKMGDRCTWNSFCSSSALSLLPLPPDSPPLPLPRLPLPLGSSPCLVRLCIYKIRCCCSYPHLHHGRTLVTWTYCRHTQKAQSLLS